MISLSAACRVANREDVDQEMQGEDDDVDDDMTLGEAIRYYQDMREKEEGESRHSHGVRPVLLVISSMLL